MAQTQQPTGEEAEEQEEVFDVRRLLDYDCHKVDNTPFNTDIPEDEYDASYGPKVYVIKYLVDWIGYDSSWWSWEPRHFLSDEYDFDEDIDLIQREQPERSTHAEVLRECAEWNAKLKEEFAAEQAKKKTKKKA